MQKNALMQLLMQNIEYYKSFLTQGGVNDHIRKFPIYFTQFWKKKNIKNKQKVYVKHAKYKSKHLQNKYFVFFSNDISLARFYRE